MPGVSLKIGHSAECLLNRQCDLIEILVTDKDFFVWGELGQTFRFYKSVLIWGREDSYCGGEWRKPENCIHNIYKSTVCRLFFPLSYPGHSYLLTVNTLRSQSNNILDIMVQSSKTQVSDPPRNRSTSQLMLANFSRSLSSMYFFSCIFAQIVCEYVFLSASFFGWLDNLFQNNEPDFSMEMYSSPS